MAEENVDRGVEGTCDYCKKSCRPLRCSQCRNMFYCSVDCQRAHWKAGHKLQCRKISDKGGKGKPNKDQSQAVQVEEMVASKAMQELQQTLVGMSIEEAHRNFQIATAEKERLEIEGKTKLNQNQNQQQQKKSSITQQRNENKQNDSTSTKNSTTKIGTGEHNTTPAVTNKIQPKIVNRKDAANKLSAASSMSLGIASNMEGKPQVVPGNMSLKKDWVYAIEQLSGISCFTVTIHPKRQPSNFLTKSTTILPQLEELELKLQPIHQHDTTLVALRRKETEELIFVVEFPVILETSHDSTSITLQKEQNNPSICIRLQSKYMITDGQDDLTRHPKTTTKDLKRLCCRFCHQALLSNETQEHEIRKVHPLPNGYWDEITDYLICYNGQPAVDFTSASAEAKRGQALEDSGILVLHREDMDTSVCVLAIEGYGEEAEKMSATATLSIKEELKEEEGKDSITYRGSRAWRDAVGGATICCSQCCSVLGFGSIESPDTFRLLKHRLSTASTNLNRIKEQEGDNIDSFAIYTCSSFVVREMVRYAESKAIFTFVVVVHTDNKGSNQKSPFEEHSSANGKCLLLRILSWDTKLAISSESRTKKDDGVDIPKFQNVAKVIYEETVDQLREEEKHSYNDDPTSWTWGGVDLCCIPTPTGTKPPTDVTANTSTSVGHRETTSSARNDKTDESTGATATPPASVRLYLSQDEWSELAAALKFGSKHFSKAVADATILVKLGRIPNSHESNIGLSALPRL